MMLPAFCAVFLQLLAVAAHAGEVPQPAVQAAAASAEKADAERRLQTTEYKPPDMKCEPGDTYEIVPDCYECVCPGKAGQISNLKYATECLKMADPGQCKIKPCDPDTDVNCKFAGEIQV
eukprot:TRINITY_DN112781_c0_g1_i1.p1 TRINITY_DN112781_c0_g1~~TRINITY_DN112781_c0_g1_i1.p1  ORF type:complete len:120 (-),score=13.52 TRINITY_DN112781_c0_g1_i1:303-662(-)